MQWSSCVETPEVWTRSFLHKIIILLVTHYIFRRVVSQVPGPSPGEKFFVIKIKNSYRTSILFRPYIRTSISYVWISCIKNSWATQYSKPFEVQKNNLMVKFLVKVDLLFVCTIRPTVQWSSCVETPEVWTRSFLHKIIILLVTHYIFRRVVSQVPGPSPGEKFFVIKIKNSYRTSILFRPYIRTSISYVWISCIKNSWATQYSKPFEVQKNNLIVKFLVKVDLLFVCTIRPTVQWSSCVETPEVWTRSFLHKIIILLVTHYIFRRVVSQVPGPSPGEKFFVIKIKNSYRTSILFRPYIRTSISYVWISCIKNSWATQYSKPFEVQKNNLMVKFLVKVDLLFVCTIRPTVQWSSCVETPEVWTRSFLHKIIILLVTHYIFRRVVSQVPGPSPGEKFFVCFPLLGNINPLKI